MKVSPLFKFGSYILDSNNHKLARSEGGNRKPVELAHIELRILTLLVQKPGQLITYDELRREIWSEEQGTDRSFVINRIQVHVSRLKKKIGDDTDPPTFILNVPRKGYRFIAPVKELPSGDNTITSNTVSGKQPQFTNFNLVQGLEQGAIDSGIDTKAASELDIHFWYVLIASIMYASLYGVSLLLEIAYQFDHYGWTAIKIAPFAFCWILVTSVAGLKVGRKRAIQDRWDGVIISPMVFLCAGLLLFGAIYQFLPSTPITQAQFQTHTATAVYLKEVFYFFILATLFFIMPFHFVTVVERDIAAGKEMIILELLTGSKRAVVPKGVLFIKPQLLGLLLVVITIWALIVRAYVLDQLLPGPYMNLFMSLYYVRLFLFLGFPAYCLGWYFWALDGLKRQCLENQQMSLPK